MRFLAYNIQRSNLITNIFWLISLAYSIYVYSKFKFKFSFLHKTQLFSSAVQFIVVLSLPPFSNITVSWYFHFDVGVEIFYFQCLLKPRFVIILLSPFNMDS